MDDGEAAVLVVVARAAARGVIIVGKQEPLLTMKILLLVYYFPPLGGAGVQRALKFAKYLPEFGITPVVIAADEPGYTTDASLLDELPPGIEVHRIRHIPLLSRVLSLLRAGRRAFGSAAAPLASGQPANRSAKSRRWRDWLLSAYGITQFPDDKAGWGRAAYERAAARLKEGDIDLIVSSAPPITAHFVAARLRRCFGVPWVADFRDMWTGNPFYLAPRWRRWLDQSAERRLLAQPDGVTAVTQEMVGRLGRDMASGRRAIFLPNGYDEADFAAVQMVARSDDRFVLLYTGTMYGHRSPEAIFTGVRHLLARRPELAGRLCLRFLGNIGARFEPLFVAFEAEYPGMVERSAYVPHEEIPRALLEADALLLVIGGGAAARGELTGKVFEYLRACRPILLLGPTDGEAARVLHETGHGVAMEEADVTGAAATLEQWLTVGLPTMGTVRNASVTRFERRALTGQLAGLLREIHRESHV